MFLGNKYERDMKEITPYVELTKKEFDKLGSLSNDELRNITLNLKTEIYDYIKADQDEVLLLKEKAENEPDFSEKERLYR